MFEVSLLMIQVWDELWVWLFPVILPPQLQVWNLISLTMDYEEMVLVKNEVTDVEKYPAKEIHQLYHHWHRGMEKQELLIVFVQEQQQIVVGHHS